MPPGGWLIVNTCKPIEEIKALTNRENIGYALVDATKLALEYLGRNVTNTIILGGLVKVAPFLFTLEQLGEAIGRPSRRKLHSKILMSLKLLSMKLSPMNVVSKLILRKIAGQIGLKLN